MQSLRLEVKPCFHRCDKGLVKHARLPLAMEMETARFTRVQGMGNTSTFYCCFSYMVTLNPIPYGIRPYCYLGPNTGVPERKQLPCKAMASTGTGMESRDTYDHVSNCGNQGEHYFSMYEDATISKYSLLNSVSNTFATTVFICRKCNCSLGILKV